VKHRLRDIVLLVGYRWRQIRNYFRDGRDWGARIRYSLDTEEYTDTGGSLLNAYKQGLLGAGTVLVWYGDILAPVDVGGLLGKHREWGADATLVLADRYQVPVGVAEVDGEGNIKRLEEKPWLPLRVTIGVLALDPRVLEGAEEALGTSFDIMGDLVPWMIKTGHEGKSLHLHWALVRPGQPREIQQTRPQCDKGVPGAVGATP